MWDAVKEFTVYGVPWWLWIAPLAAGALIKFMMFSRAVGFRNALIATGVLAMGMVTALAHRKGRQRGWQDRQDKEDANARQVLKRAQEARDRARERDSDPERLYDDDGFKRQQ